MDKQKPTYENLKTNPLFLNAAYHTLRGLGENTSKDPEEIIDTFLTKRRWFNANLGATIGQADDILNDFSPAMLNAYQYAVDQIDAVPNFGEGSAPKWDATTDYIKAAITDPANIASVAAAFFTFGGGGAAGFAAKEAAKLGLKEAISSKLKTLVSKQALKVYALEGSIAGTGSGVQEDISQDVEIATGKRTEKDYGDIALHAGIGTVSAPVVGITGRAVSDFAVKPIFNLTKESLVKPIANKLIGADRINRVTNTLKNNIIPTPQLDEGIMRVAELTTGRTQPLEEAVEKLTAKMDKEIKTNFSSKTDTDLLNKALEGDKGALKLIKDRSPEMSESIKEWANITRQLQDIAGAGKFINDKIKSQYKYNKDKPYARDIYDKFTSSSREPFEDFKRKNPDILRDLKALLKSDPEYGKKAGILNNEGKIIAGIDIDKKVEEFAENQYGSVINRRRTLGPLIKRQTEIPEVVKTIWGYNNKPAVRALETAKGIVESSKQMRLASSLAESLLGRGIAKKIPEGDVIPENMVKLVTSQTREAGSEKINPSSEAAFSLSKFQMLKGLDDVYIDKNHAKTVKALVEQFDNSRVNIEKMGINPDQGLAGELINIFGAVQGGLKKGKTVYNPIAHIRNAMGATQYLIASGNGRGIYDGMKFFATASAKEKQDMWDTVSRLGLKGSQVDLNQIFTRLGDLDKLQGSSGKKAAREVAVGMLTFGQNGLEKIPGLKQLSKGAEKVYMGTDDLAKIAAFMRERSRSQKIWDNMSDEVKRQKRKEYSQTFRGGAAVPGQETALKNLDTNLINEMAVSKVMNLVPVYSRIPPIIEKLRGIPFVGNFAAFPAENLRTKYNLFKMSGNEIQEGLATGNKALVNTGLQRLASQATIAGGAYAGTWAYNKIEGTDKYVEAIRNTLPEWSRDGALAVSEDKNGRITYQNMSYINPDQYVLDLIMPFILDVQSGRDVEESTMDTISTISKRLFQPFIGESLATESAIGFADAVRSLAMDVTGIGNKDTLDKFVKVMKVQEPGWFKISRELAAEAGVLDTNKYNAAILESKLSPRLPGEKPERLENYSLFENLSRYGVNPLEPWALGVKTEEFKPREQLAYSISTLDRGQSKTYKQGREDINAIIGTPTLSLDADVGKDIKDIYKEMLSTEFNSRQQMKDLLLSYGSFLKPAQINNLLLNDSIVRGSSLSKNQARYLAMNRFMPTKLSDSKALIKKIKESNKNRPRSQQMRPSVFRNILVQVEKEFNNRSLANDLKEED
jgi:hypothetical protein